MQKENNGILVATHLSQLLDFVTGFGGFIVPLVIWLTQKDEIHKMDEHGKSVINFQLSMLVYCILCIPLILFFGLGLLGFLVIAIFAAVFPVYNAIKASNGGQPYYPMSISFIK
ncbi:MAG: DUF4870 domain-containing protein [Flavobacteriaceae bacterium]|nr:DUF4870 domain-containing protein [Flavobacteriaceae bacterium]